MITLCGTIYKYEEKPVNNTWNVITVSLNYNTLFKVYYTEYNNKKLIKPYCVYQRTYSIQRFDNAAWDAIVQCSLERNLTFHLSVQPEMQSVQSVRSSQQLSTKGDPCLIGEPQLSQSVQSVPTSQQNPSNSHCAPSSQ